ncbi:miniconductance mechanosensitive channel MscM [Morganella morganii]|uniref:Miniconductance mechanosensitive channel MscM n=1 Tax=Morganella morganii TaxID=582 RepID=A0AAU8ZKE4_MORMO|nr:miniconductance mechanosensitive channel MscM [Morganella morganii]AWC93514.1 miniconductance mechanosensitive channel MscM [Morganella morganii]EKW8486753.1 miniconductance mechanosensitive channel MscM [Morganella morganii]HAT3623880.1 miniconductance mechanosensitive channel MscM [Morganella morganii]
MRLIISFLLAVFLFSPLTAVYAASDINEPQIRQELKRIESSKDPKDIEMTQALQATLNWLTDSKAADERAQSYQDTIDNFPKLVRALRQQLLEESDSPAKILTTRPISDLEQQAIQLSGQLLEQGRLLQQEQDKNREISDSLTLLPQQQSEARRLLNEATSRQQGLTTPLTPLAEARATLAAAEVQARKATVNELELAQLSANNRQELTRIRLELLRKRYQRLDLELQQLRSVLNGKRQQKAELALERTELLAEQAGDLPPYLKEQIDINRELSQVLNDQAAHMSDIGEMQRQAATDIQKARQVLGTIQEQAQWLNGSTALGEALRAQLSRLPDMPKPQQLDKEITDLRVERLKYENMLDALSGNNNDPDTSQTASLPADQASLYQQLIQNRKELLGSLLSGYDTEILELTKLKVTTSQLSDVLIEVRDDTHRYLFWVADAAPVYLNYPIEVLTSLTKLLSLDTLAQLGGAFKTMFSWQNKEISLYIIGTLLLAIFGLNYRRHYQAFLDRTSQRIGKVTLDRFSITLRTLFWSVLVSLPLPVLWSAIGYGLQNAWQYPMAKAIGDGVSATTPVLWLFMFCATFARPNGLFIAQFRWPEARVKRAMRFYQLSIFVIVPLMMAMTTFEYFNDREFAPTLGRLCFLLLCAALFIITSSLRRAGVPLYLDRHGSGDNAVSKGMWWLLLMAPVVAAIAALLGYLATSQALLGRLETSVAIWFMLLVVYNIITRWMLIQRRRIAFERAKQRRAEILAQRAKSDDDSSVNSNANSAEGVIDIEEQVIDLDTISAQSVGLVRSILTMIALVSCILLWSELHTAFSFLENIRLWDVSSSINGVDTLQPITLGSVFVAILVIIITTQLVRNLPALLELALLQHLDLTPGTGYAITTLTKYSITLVGGIVGFSLIGIEWSKMQWFVTAMGVGLGFGLQEIFANIVSGLMILFEKPIRIGDTVTIRDLTGSITRINTRATTLTDWDRKEIIVPNKAFITEQFINWSLSDTVTRIVLTIPVPAEANPEQVTILLLMAAQDSAMILDTPNPEAYLVDLQQGIQIFELRAYAAEMGHRLPARHEIHQNILRSFAENNIILPFPPFEARVDMVGNILRSGTKNLSGRNPMRKSGGL